MDTHGCLLNGKPIADEVVHTHTVHDEIGVPICRLGGNVTRDRDTAEIAALIAVAPELLAALRALADNLERNILIPEGFKSLLFAARAAIAKVQP
jgi:hypothetical protein